jgi:hypothetical protein
VGNMAALKECIAVYQIMQSFNKPWAIAGGWSIDLFLGKVTREHDDIEIAIYRNDQSAIQAYLDGWNFTKVHNRKVLPWERNEFLALPIHETYAEKANEKIEILMNEVDRGYWLYRRDTRVKREIDKAFLTTNSGIPYLSPEIALLYKSKYPRPKDEFDFRNIYHYMSMEQKQWLQESLKLIYTEHSWIDMLNRRML